MSKHPIIAGISIAAALALGAAPMRPAPPTTCWDGTTGAGPALRRIVVTLEGDRGGIGGGALLFLGRPERRAAIDVGVQTGDSVRFRPRDPMASWQFSGAWSGDGDSLAGMLRRATGEPAPFILRRVAPPPLDSADLGSWHGVLGGGFPARVGLRLAAGPCGLLIGTMDSPDQGEASLPLTAAQVTADSVVVEAGYVGIRLTLDRAAAGNRTGTFTQHGAAQPISLARGSPVARRPQDPVKPYPYGEHDVRFENGADGVRFAGTLSVPRTPGPHPAVVLLSGSGAQDRDELVAGHRPFLVLADHLTRQGLAVLRFDDRGVGGSTGDVLTSTVDDNAGDALAAVAALTARPDIDRTRIGLIGHSEGGLVAPLAASRSPDIAFLVLLAGPGQPGLDLLVSQRAAIGRASGDRHDLVRADSLLIREILSVVASEPSSDALPDRVDERLRTWRRGLPPDVGKLIDSLLSALSARTPAQDSSSVKLWRSPWFQFLVRYDPAPVLERVRVPVLIVFGELDHQVPAGANIAALTQAFERGGNRSVTVARFPGVNHMLQPAKTGLMEEYVQIEETIAPAVLERIGRWIAEQSAAGRR